MSILDTINADIIKAMKAKEELKLSTLRMAKSALKAKEIDKRAPLEEKEELAILSTLIKQRKDSAEQFTKGGRPELAEKEISEIALIEVYMPKAVGADEVATAIDEVFAALPAPPTAKDTGSVMKAVMAKFAGARVDGKLVNELVRKKLS